MSDNDSRLLEMPGHLIRRLQQIASALFLEQAKPFDFTPGPVRRPGRHQEQSGPRSDHAVQHHRARPLDHRRCGGAAGEARADKPGQWRRRPAHQDAAHYRGRQPHDQRHRFRRCRNAAVDPGAAQAGRAHRLHGDAQASGASQQRAQPRAAAAERHARYAARPRRSAQSASAATSATESSAPLMPVAMKAPALRRQRTHPYLVVEALCSPLPRGERPSRTRAAPSAALDVRHNLNPAARPSRSRRRGCCRPRAPAARRDRR